MCLFQNSWGKNLVNCILPLQRFIENIWHYSEIGPSKKTFRSRTVDVFILIPSAGIQENILAETLMSIKLVQKYFVWGPLLYNCLTNVLKLKWEDRKKDDSSHLAVQIGRESIKQKTGEA
jgi:hypothetical protein